MGRSLADDDRHIQIQHLVWRHLIEPIWSTYQDLLRNNKKNFAVRLARAYDSLTPAQARQHMREFKSAHPRIRKRAAAPDPQSSHPDPNVAEAVRQHAVSLMEMSKAEEDARRAIQSAKDLRTIKTRSRRSAASRPHKIKTKKVDKHPRSNKIRAKSKPHYVANADVMSPFDTSEKPKLI